MRARGLEPPILSEPDPKSGASAIPPRARRAQDACLMRKAQAGSRKGDVSEILNRSGLLLGPAMNQAALPTVDHSFI